MYISFIYRAQQKNLKGSEIMEINEEKTKLLI